MKLLVSWIHELGRYVSREFHYTMRELIDVQGWKHVEPWRLADLNPSPAERLIGMAGEIPETILFWETYDLFNTVSQALRGVGCRLAMFADDLHSLGGHDSIRESKLRALTSCDAILASYGYAFDRFYPELARQKEVFWIPHAASPDYSLPINENPENAILLSGFIGPLYPLRVQLDQARAAGRLAIVRHAHPGYREDYDYQADSRIGSGYASKIHRFKAAFTDASVFGYVVGKHFEIPATGSLLVAGDSVTEELKQLGFEPQVHYLPACEGNLEQTIQFALDDRNRAAIEEIRRRGQQLVLGRHRTSDRARAIDLACTAKSCATSGERGIPYELCEPDV